MPLAKIKKYVYLAVILTIYVVAIAVICLPYYRETDRWGEFWLIVGASEAVVLLLVYVSKRREALRKKKK